MQRLLVSRWRGEAQVWHGARKDENAESRCTSSEGSCPRLPVRTLRGLADVREREGAAFWLAECLYGAASGAEMIGARVRVLNEGGSFTVVVCAESLRAIEQTAKIRYPGSTVRIAFPIETEYFFASGPHTGVRAGREAIEGLTEPTRLS
jgi:hypothetical protein